MVAKVGTPSTIAPVPAEGIIEVRNVDFNGTSNELKCLLKGNGSVTLRLDDKDGADLTTVSSTADSWQTLHAPLSSLLSGTHTVYFIMKGDVLFDKWVLGDASLTGISPSTVSPSAVSRYYDLQGRQHGRPVPGLNIVRMSNGSVRKVIKH